LAATFDGRVERMFDHHKDMGAHPEVEGSQRKVREGVGSACTIIAKELLDSGVGIPRDLGVMLHATILVDVRNFDPAQRKFNEEDQELFPRLASFCPEPPGQTAWFDELTRARATIDHLRAGDLLKLDYKETTRGGWKVGVPSLMCTVAELVSKAGGAEAFISELRSFAHERGLHLLVSNGAKDNGIDGQPKGLITYSADDAAVPLAQKLEEILAASPQELPRDLVDLELAAQQGVRDGGFELRADPGAPTQERPRCRCFHMQNKISRKMLLPAVGSALGAVALAGAAP